MHILLIHQAFAALDEAGGTRHHEFAQHLVTLGHKVTIIASPISYLTGKQRDDPTIGSKEENRNISNPGEKPDEEVQRNVGTDITIIRTYTYSALHKSFVHRVISFLSFMISSFLAGIKVTQVDIIWGTSPPIFQGVTAWLLARLKQIPMLFEVRDLWPDFAVDVGVLHNPVLIRASRWLEAFLYQHADRVIVNSPGYIDHVTKRGAGNVTLIPNGADPQMFFPDLKDRSIRQQYQLNSKFIVLYAGAHGMSNDLDIILQAANQLKHETGISIVLIGDGKEKSKLIALANTMRLPNVIFADPVPKTRMAGVLANADACIAILKPIEMYKTTYPNKVFDYMAAGRPIILAIDGVIREVIEEAACGIAIPPGDPKAMAAAIKQLATDAKMRLAMGKSGRSFVEKNFNRRELVQRLGWLMEDMKK
jgi:glycosyltransferase involved in cell wall biosynthesis